jgi:hypothetical protein
MPESSEQAFPRRCYLVDVSMAGQCGQHRRSAGHKSDAHMGMTFSVIVHPTTLRNESVARELRGTLRDYVVADCGTELRTSSAAGLSRNAQATGVT